MGQKELEEALAGKRPASQIDWDVKPMGPWVVFAIASATHDPLYPLTNGQARALARAIQRGLAVERHRREMRVGFRYDPPVPALFRSYGVLELIGGKTNTGFHIPAERLPRLAQTLLKSARAAGKFKAKNGSGSSCSSQG